MTARPSAAPAALLTLLLLAACGPEPGGVPGQAEAPVGAEAAEDGPRAIYERHLVFVSRSRDSSLAVPLMFRTTSSPATVRNEVRGWLARGGEWDPFFLDAWTTGPRRSPWRILPRGPLRLVVGPGDALERVAFSQGARELELVPGEVLADWAGPRGEAVRVHEADLTLSSRRVAGWLLDMARGWTEPNPGPGDLVILTSGDSLQVVMEAETETTSAEIPTPWRGWARMDFEDRLWDRVSTQWSGVRTFEPARRQIPAGWTLATGDSTLVGTLTVTSSDLAAGAGEGPMRPVEAVFEVEGILRLFDREFPVQGVLRHSQRF